MAFTDSMPKLIPHSYIIEYGITHLDKTDGSRLFTETLSAKVKSVLAYETGLMGTESARVNG